MKKPLNGSKTHPLSAHALEELRHISEQPLPRSSMNPGVANRLEREALVETVELPSPFVKYRKGKTCPHLKITDEGLKRLQQVR
ncbi:hypothetical protein SAMN02949497_1623 [Methylomagnum ishizawai]|uniref:Uncharacterized protein n=1 Tax=Methylomagnum ishizawai TaxID=1760988 RepID=A0A1Y6D0F9_9GAMM|nr:hypothetical protein [Methylomagnum ishizawai]SMF94313.1 hypothetical protein SAMN02949497_1623 [Methylomagnum ishizawai]